VRADRLTLHRTPQPDAREVAVRAVEYQGTCVLVKVSPVADGAETFWTASVPDALFDAGPLAPGETVYATWPAKDAHALVA